MKFSMQLPCSAVATDVFDWHEGEQVATVSIYEGEDMASVDLSDASVDTLILALVRRHGHRVKEHLSDLVGALGGTQTPRNPEPLKVPESPAGAEHLHVYTDGAGWLSLFPHREQMELRVTQFPQVAATKLSRTRVREVRAYLGEWLRTTKEPRGEREEITRGWLVKSPLLGYHDKGLESSWVSRSTACKEPFGSAVEAREYVKKYFSSPAFPAKIVRVFRRKRVK